ncbi:MAG: TerD family protein [Gemmatimonadaceae bacterium]|nr:TerD family protein [Gemmatimonadaceae bacterium]
MLQLPLEKNGQPPKKLSLSLNKASRFIVELWWKTEHDLDAHALLATNSGQGAKVDAFEKVLSTYNCKRPGSQSGVLAVNANKSFNTPDGALHHSGDSLDGRTADIDEVITIDGGKIGPEVNEIPIFVTIHPRSQPMTFREIPDAGIRIKDDAGKVLGEFQLTAEFGPFNAVQMGSLIIGANGWEYAAVGNGFTGDFNTVLGYFS